MAEKVSLLSTTVTSSSIAAVGRDIMDDEISLSAEPKTLEIDLTTNEPMDIITEPVCDSIIVIDNNTSDSNECGVSNSVDQHHHQQNEAHSRKSNFPYDSNSSWESFDCEEFCAYRVLPKELNLNDRAFAISVFLKRIGCRFNCGDIISGKDDLRLVFLGVRFEKEPNSGKRAIIMYFFPFANVGDLTGGTLHILLFMN